MTLSTILLQAQAQSSGWTSIIMMVALIAIFYFFMIRPQQKRQKEIQKAREALASGDKVITAGGIYGKVKEVNEKYFVIEIAENTRIRVAKDSVYPAADETPKQA
ncbi:MAG: preprotein translocase subunit YajC [Bacteroidaceae bacterium]|nr:preprotein translocase subunit YajC [Bacteroidaceae bacterium]